MSPAGWRTLLGDVAMPDDVRERLPVQLDHYRFTPHEREIVALMLAGRSTKEICAEMGITHGTFYNSYSRIASKVDRPNTERLVVILTILGIGDLP